MITNYKDKTKEELIEELVKMKSEQLYRSILDASPDPITITDLEGKILHISKSVQKIFGFDASFDFSNHSILEFIAEQDLEKAANAMMQMFLNEFPGAEEYKGVKFDGSTFDIEVNAEFFRDQAGRPVNIMFVTRDITLRKQTEEKLKQMQESYRNLVENINEIIYEIDDKGIVKYVSPAVERVLGYTAEDLIGNNLFHYMYPEDIPTLSSALANLANRDSSNLEYRYYKKDGTVRWVRSSTKPIFENGAIVGGVGVLIDINERKLAEDSLRKSELKYRQIFETVQDAYYEATLDGILLEISPAIETISKGQYKREDLIGQSIIQFYADPDARAAFFTQLHKTGRVFDYELIFINKDGTDMPVAISSGLVFDSLGNPIRITGSIRDISERKNAEKEIYKFRTIAEQANYGVVLSSLDGIFQYVNATYAKMLGWEMDDLLGKNLSDIHSKAQLTRVEEIIELMKTQGGFVSEELNLSRKDGSTLPVLMSSKVIFSANNEPQFISATVIDITDIKKTQDALRSSETNLSYAQEISKLGSWELDLETNNFFWSDNYYRLVGLAPQCEGITNNYFFDHVFSEDCILLEEMLEEIKKTRKPATRDIRFKMPDGSMKWFQDFVVPSFTEDNITGIYGVILDVTERKIIQDELLDSEESLSYAQQIAKMGNWEHNFKTNLLTGSANYYRMLGLEPFDKSVDLFDHFSHLVHPDDKIHLLNIRDSAFIDHDVEVINMRMLMPDGQLHWFQNHIVPMLEGKELIGIRGVNVDITEQKLKDDLINKLSLAVEQSPILIVITDLQGIIEYVNPVFTSVTGYAADEVIGKNTRFLKSGKTDKTVYEDLWATITADKEWHGEWINKKKTGEFYWENVSITPLHDETGFVTNYVAVKQDVSQRKKIEQEIHELNENLEIKIQQRTDQLAKTNTDLLRAIEERQRLDDALVASEQSYQTVVENVNEVIFQTDINGLWLFLNKSWEKVTGFSVEESLGVFFINYVHPDDRQSNRTLFDSLMNREKDDCRYEIRYLTKDGGFRWIEVFVRLGVNDKDELTGTYGTLQDITERKNANQIVLQAKEEAEQANLAKSEFLSRMSHELRTPMNSILGFAQLLEMGELQPIQEKGVSHIMTSGKHLLSLINDVLDISRIEAGRLSISIEPIKINEILEEMLDVIRPLATKKQIKLELIISANEQLYVNFDRQSLKQILLNLLNNAIKYNKPLGSIVLKTQVMPMNEDGKGFIRISMTDSGVGISAENIPKLFTPFERIGADKSDIEGSGLGLAVVKKLIDAMDSSLGVESVVGEGSTFWIDLPKVENRLEKLQKSEHLTGSDDESYLKKGTILYIEDNVSNIELIEQILSIKRPEIKLISEIKGKQAVSLAVDYQPDLILLDLNLPDIHGSEVLRLILANELTKNIPVVIVSADAMHDQVEKLVKAGAKMFLTKPIDVILLLNTIDTYLEN